MISLPYVRITRNFPDGKKTIIDVAQTDLPEEYMDQYKQILGNAQAKVSVGADMALKEFGSGAGAHVSVTLSCDQSQDVIETAIDLAGKIARAYCVEQQKQAEQELLASQAQKQQLGGGYGHQS